MKILFAIDAYLSHSNGTSISAQRYAQTLRRFGHEVRILSNADQSDNGVYYPLRAMSIPGFNGMLRANGFQYAKPDDRLIGQALAWCDIVHIYTPFFLGCRVKKMAQQAHVPFSTAFHVQAENISSAFHMGNVEPVNRFIYRIHWKTMYHDARFIHCPSQLMADELRHYGFTADLRVISNGISGDFVYYRPADEGHYPAADEPIVISMVGRLSPEKRQDLLIKAAALSKYSERIRLQFAGTGSVEQYYRRLGRKLPHEPEFGYYTREQLIELLHRTHLYVHASDMESEAIGCIEAFATGLVPIISDSRLSATKQFALSEKSLFRAGDAASLAERIDWWVEHPEERLRMEKCYAQAAESYRLETCVHQFEAMLFEAMTYYAAEWGIKRPAAAI